MRRPDELTVLPQATVLVVGYFTIQVAANLTVMKATPLPFGLAIPIGSLLYAISFTWIDLVNQRLGRSNARRLVVVSVGANLMLALWLQLYIVLPGDSTWQADPANQAAIATVLGSLPRILLASLATNFVVENADITVYSFLRQNFPQVPIIARSAISNTVSAPLDGILFAVLAFSFTLPAGEVATIALTSALYKLCVGYLSSPLIYIGRTREDRR
ncbi:queuosine precursor transporter [Actinoplanes solisilvae]|uniref:queuosine precursor transporter n=1 Tax=Actinoplanes solisilvae TaxID=2486853 RepID=UPI000FD74A89|nr:queuosine precursor transporter [Actinoplanes solisilvae]